MSAGASAITDWIGRKTAVEEQIAAGPAAGMIALLDRDDPPPRAGDSLPPLWHWLFFIEPARQSELDIDGHPKRGGFLPPISLPRRMWAGARFTFHAPLCIGDEARRESEIIKVEEKTGASGALVFVTVETRIFGSAGLAVVEQADIVYREAVEPGTPPAPPEAAPTPTAWRRGVHPDPVFLFRMSALTFNGHRIHYDRAYATEIEGYPGLVVHGPLQAILLADLVRRRKPEAAVARFSCRARRPVFDTGDFDLVGQPADDGGSCRLWALDNDGSPAMSAKAEFA